MALDDSETKCTQEMVQFIRDMSQEIRVLIMGVSNFQFEVTKDALSPLAADKYRECKASAADKLKTDTSRSR